MVLVAAHVMVYSMAYNSPFLHFTILPEIMCSRFLAATSSVSLDLHRRGPEVQQSLLAQLAGSSIAISLIIRLSRGIDPFLLSARDERHN